MSFSVFSPLNELRNRIVMADDGKREDPGNEAGLTSYTFYATGETRSITSHITCNTTKVIYIVQLCYRCNLQYTGETKRSLKDRFNEHRHAVDKTNIKSIPTTVSEHFLSREPFS